MRTNDARHALLARLIDHAPTFPPAALPPEEALAEDARAAASPHAFMLGRLVWRASALAEVRSIGREISAVLDAPLAEDVPVESVELPPGADLDALPDVSEVYIEVRLDDDLERQLDAIQQRGSSAKVRCSGAPVRLARFMLECRERGIPYKATAGLHHAVTTDAEYGFLNVLASAVFQDEDALSERDRGRLVAGADTFRWGGRSAGLDEILEAREGRLRSIGSCSFFEPVEELEALGVLPL